MSDPRKGLRFLLSLVFVGGRHVRHSFMNSQIGLIVWLHIVMGFSILGHGSPLK